MALVIAELGGVADDTTYTTLEMEMLGGGAPCTTREGYELTGTHTVAYVNKILGVVTVKGLQTIDMLDLDTFAIARIML